MYRFTTPGRQEALIDLALKQIEKMLKEMQTEGHDLVNLRLKKFQKTHHIDCRCGQCKKAKSQNDPRLRGLRELGFKVYLEGQDKEVI